MNNTITEIYNNIRIYQILIFAALVISIAFIYRHICIYKYKKRVEKRIEKYFNKKSYLRDEK